MKQGELKSTLVGVKSNDTWIAIGKAFKGIPKDLWTQIQSSKSSPHWPETTIGGEADLWVNPEIFLKIKFKNAKTAKNYSLNNTGKGGLSIQLPQFIDVSNKDSVTWDIDFTETFK